MSEFQIKIIKNRKDELEVDFNETITKKADGDGLKILGDEEWQKGKKGHVYKEVSSRELAEVLKTRLVDKGIDAYTYEPHPLTPGYRLHVAGNNPKKELKKVLGEVRKEWDAWGTSLQKKLK